MNPMEKVYEHRILLAPMPKKYLYAPYGGKTLRLPADPALLRIATWELRRAGYDGPLYSDPNLKHPVK